MSSALTNTGSPWLRLRLAIKHYFIHGKIERTKYLIRAQPFISMENLRVYMLKAGRTFTGSTAVVCEKIGDQIDSDLEKVAL